MANLSTKLFFRQARKPIKSQLKMIGGFLIPLLLTFTRFLAKLKHLELLSPLTKFKLRKE